MSAQTIGLLKACRGCEETRPLESFAFITRYGKPGRYPFSLCRICRDAIPEASCSRCKRTLPRDAFYEHPSRSCGLSSYCIKCANKQAVESVTKFQRRTQIANQQLRAVGAEGKHGQCLGFVNLGGFSASVRCSNKATVGTGGYCLVHATAEAKRAAPIIQRRLKEGPSPTEWEQILIRRKRETREASLRDPELGDLISAQEKDAYFNCLPPRYLAGRLVASLDEPVIGVEDTNMGSKGPARQEVRLAKGETELDPALVLERVQDAERLFALAGTREPDDILRMDSLSLARLQDRLRLEGFTPHGVQDAERDRLRNPDRHTGEYVAPGRSKHGRKTRRQKIAHKEANRARGNSNRPSQKPRRRWTRDDWMEEEA